MEFERLSFDHSMDTTGAKDLLRLSSAVQWQTNETNTICIWHCYFFSQQETNLEF